VRSPALGFLDFMDAGSVGEKPMASREGLFFNSLLSLSIGLRG